MGQVGGAADVGQHALVLQPLRDGDHVHGGAFGKERGHDAINLLMGRFIKAALVEQIQRLRDKQGEFGCYLQLAHNWANWEATKKSYELYARHVVPHFRGSNAHRASSNAWAYEHRMEFSTLRDAATKKMFDQHEAERAAKAKARGEAAE